MVAVGYIYMLNAIYLPSFYICYSENSYMEYINIWEPGGVYRKYYGLMTGAIIREAVEKVEGDQRFDNISYILNDYLDVTGLDVSQFELNAIAAIDSVASNYNKNIKIAQVATRQDIIDLVTDYDDKLQENTYKTKVFSNVADARKWLEDER